MTKIPSYLTDSSGLLLQMSVIGVKDINPHRKFILRPWEISGILMSAGLR